MYPFLPQLKIQFFKAENSSDLDPITLLEIKSVLINCIDVEGLLLKQIKDWKMGLIEEIIRQFEDFPTTNDLVEEFTSQMTVE